MPPNIFAKRSTIRRDSAKASSLETCRGTWLRPDGVKSAALIARNSSRFAAYNRWANSRLYAAALDLSEQAYRLYIGVFFGSLHGTLNHLLLTDRLWLKRLTGEGDHPNRLDTILYEERAELTRARIAEDNRLITVVGKYDDAALTSLHSYKTTSGMPQSQVLSDILLHLFNHQTHHRGQAHACLSILTGGEPPSLDMLVFQRGGTAPDLQALH
jgi:uncharacterized damage-inducible protein DinB